MLSCQVMTEIVTDYVESRISLRRRLEFWLHLAHCSHCRAYLWQMRTTVKILGKLQPDTGLASDVEERMVARFRSASEPVPNTGATLTTRWLHRLQRGLGAGRGRVFIVSVLAGLTAMSAAIGHAGPLGDVVHGLVETASVLGFALTTAVLLRRLAAASSMRLSGTSYASLAVLGVLPLYFVLLRRCPLCHVVAHVLVFHVASLAIAALLAAALGGARWQMR